MAGALPPDWKIVPFREIADYRLGRTPPRNSGRFWSASSAAFPWVSIADLRPFGTVNRTTESVTADAYEEIFQRQLAPAGTLLMSFKLTIGRTSVLDIDAFHNEAIISIFPRESVDRDFLKFYLPTINFADHQDRAVKGQTLNRGKIDRLPVVLPPLDEQRVIAHTLETIRLRVEKEAAICDKLAALKSATMAKLFREGLRGEPLKQTEIGEIPESWEVVRLGDRCKLKSGGTPSRAVPEYWGGDIPWVKTTEINYREIRDTDEKITQLGLENSSAKVFDKGTVLMAMYGQGVTRGRVALLGIPAATNQACAAFFPDETISPRFLHAYFTHAYERVRELGHGANQRNLSLELLEDVKIPVPKSIDEQEEISHIVADLQRRIELSEK